MKLNVSIYGAIRDGRSLMARANKEQLSKLSWGTPSCLGKGSDSVFHTLIFMSLLERKFWMNLGRLPIDLKDDRMWYFQVVS